MSLAKNKPWNLRWVVGDILGRGGQGTTFLVTPRAGNIAQGQYVLKILNSQNDPDRRGRMYREVAALRTLNNSGVPIVVESNAEQYADHQEPLYLVTEFIDGQTLEKRVASERMILSDAVKMLMRLTGIVTYCHELEVVHRDIKPDNVVLRGNSVADPVLLDFGQSFNREATEKSALTCTGQQLGNRFLALPELQLDSGNKRDPRSDLTQLCGLLLYALSGEHPVTLLDDESRMPHQRPELAQVLSRLPQRIRTQLNRLFDTGFAVAIDRRFQSALGLQASLQLVAEAVSDPQAPDTAEVITELRDRLSAPRFERQQQVRLLFEQIDQLLKHSLDKVQQNLGSVVSTIQGGFSIKMAGLSYENGMGLTFANDETRQFFPRFLAMINGNEVVLTGIAEGRETELLRAPIAGPHSWHQPLIEAAANYFVKGFEEKCADL